MEILLNLNYIMPILIIIIIIYFICFILEYKLMFFSVFKKWNNKTVMLGSMFQKHGEYAAGD